MLGELVSPRFRPCDCDCEALADALGDPERDAVADAPCVRLKLLVSLTLCDTVSGKLPSWLNNGDAVGVGDCPCDDDSDSEREPLGVPD